MFKHLTILVALCIVFTSGNAQYPDWMNYTNGKEVLCLLKDGNFIWAGTTGGLVKLDKTTGNSIVYTKTNSGIPSNHVTALARDFQGNLWIGTMTAGVTRFDGVTWTTYNEYLDTSHPITMVSAIACHPNGGVWVGATAGSAGGIYHFFNNTWTKYGYAVTSISGGIESMVIDNAGLLYVGSEMSGMSRFDGTTWTHYTPSNSNMLNIRIHDLAIDSQNNVWACSWNCGGPGGLSKFDGTNFTTYLLNHSIETIAIDSLDNIWLSEYPFVLSRFDGINLVSFDSSNSQAQVLNVAFDILVDGSDIWFGTNYANGLMKFDGNSLVTSYNTSQSGISLNNNYAIAIDTNGIVYSSVSRYSHPQNGIDRLDQNGFTNLNMANSGLPVSHVTSISVNDFDNNLWMGTTNDGVISYDGTNFTHYDSTTYNLIGSRVNHELVFDASGNIYCLFMWHYNASGVKTGAGIMKFNGNSWTKINLSAIADTLITNIAIDNQNQLWATGPGIIEKHNLFNPVVFTSSNSAIPNNESFISLLCDHNNNIWAGSFTGGIFKIENSQTLSSFQITSCTWFSYGDGINSMAIDKNNNLWFSIFDFCTFGGLVLAKFDGTAFTYFDVNNSGLSYEPYRIRTRDNKIYMTTGNGLVVYTDPTLSSGVAPEGDSISPLVVSPNPSDGKVRIKFTLNTDSPLTVEVVNMQGQLVHSHQFGTLTQGNNSIDLDLGDLPNAVYIVRLITDSGTFHSKVNMINNK